MQLPHLRKSLDIFLVQCCFTLLHQTHVVFLQMYKHASSLSENMLKTVSCP